MKRIHWFHVGMVAICVCFVITIQAHAQVAFHEVNFGSSNGDYTVTNVGNIQNEWTWAAGDGWQVRNQGGDGNPNNLSKLTSPPIAITDTGLVELNFDHRYTIEADWDAGAVFTSVNGGPFQQVEGTSFTKNGYTKQGLLGQHFLNDGEGFNGDSADFSAGALITSAADLGMHDAGDSLQVQFVGAWDQFATGAFTPPEWQIGSVAVSPQRTDPFLPATLPGPSGRAGFWGVREITGNGTIGSLSAAVESATNGGGTIVDGQLPILDVTDPDTNVLGGPVLSGTPLPFLSNTVGDDNDITSVAKGTVRVAEGGEYTFQVRSNDGFALRVVGQQFTSVHGNGFVDPNDASTMVRPSDTADANTRGVINLAAGDYEVEVLAYEGANEAFYEVTSAQGVHTASDTAQWIAMGDETSLPETVSVAGPLVSLNAPASILNTAGGAYPRANADIFTAGEFVFSNPDFVEETDSLALSENNVRQHASPDQTVLFPNAEGNPSANMEDYATAIVGQIVINDGDDVEGEMLDITFGMFSDDDAMFHIVGESFTSADGGNATTQLSDVDGDMALTFPAATGDSNSFGQITIEEGVYDFEGFHIERGGGSHYEIFAAEGFLQGWSGSAFELVVSPVETVLPENIGLALVGEPGGDPDLDFNGDTVVDVSDIDMLMSEVAMGTNGASFDLTGDGVVDDADRDSWLAGAATENGLAGPYLLGDANLDGMVSPADLNQVGINWQSDAKNWSEGNFTGAGVNAGDLNALAINWNQSIAPAAAAVPEPAGLLLLAIGGCIVFLRRRS